MGHDNSSYRALWRTPHLPALLASMALARLAARMFSLALVLFVLARYASPTLAGWAIFAAVVPGLILSPICGAVLDRVGPTVAVALDLAASAVFTAMLAAASWLGWADPTLLFILVILYSITGPLGASGIRSLLPRMVPVETLDRANALDTAIWAAVDVLGAALAGLCVAWLGPETTILLIAFVYAGAAMCLWRVPRLASLNTVSASLLLQALEGILIVARQPTLRGLAISYSLYQVTWGVLVVAIPVFAVQHFTADKAETATGLLWAAAGLAGGLGALVAGHLRATGRERGIMLAGMTISALAAWPIAAEFGLAGLVIGLLILGALAGPIDVALLTLRQRRTDPRQFGRVLSISMSLNVAGYPIGSALAGMVIGGSLSMAFLLAGAAALLAALATVFIPREPENAHS
ncbi:MAG: MFS transporter [Pseudomonadota bacterium]